MHESTNPILQKYKRRERKINAATFIGVSSIIGLVFAFGADEKDLPVLNTHEPAVVIEQTPPTSHYEPSTFSSENDPAIIKVNQCTADLIKCAVFTVKLSNEAYYEHVDEFKPGNTIVMADING